MSTRHDDPQTFKGAVTFDGTCTFANTPAEIALTNLTSLAIGADGAGTAAPALTLKKTAAGTGDVAFKAADSLRGRIRLNASEAIVIETFDGSEASTGTVTMSNAAGAVALSGALAVTGTTTMAAATCTTLAASGAVTCATTLAVTGTTTAAAINASGTVAAAGAVTVGTTLGVTGAATLSSTLAVAGAVTITLASVREAADDTAAAALDPAVPVGGLYRTGSALKIRAA